MHNDLVTDPQIRLAQSADIAALAEVHRKCFARQKMSQQWITCCLGAYPYKQIFVISIDEKIIGYAIWSEKSGFRECVVLELEQVAIAPAFQAQGVGGILIESSLNQASNSIHARGDRVSGLYVTTRADNRAAQSLYSRTMGVEVVATIPDLFSGVPEVVMTSKTSAA